MKNNDELLFVLADIAKGNPEDRRKLEIKKERDAMNETAKHTPGDWRLGIRSGERAIYGPKGEEIAVFTAVLFDDEVLANARLIASAPNLLAHLRFLVEGIANGIMIPPDGAAVCAAREVIAKAEGRV